MASKANLNILKGRQKQQNKQVKYFQFFAEKRWLYITD